MRTAHQTVVPFCLAFHGVRVGFRVGFRVRLRLGLGLGSVWGIYGLLTKLKYKKRTLLVIYSPSCPKTLPAERNITDRPTDGRRDTPCVLLTKNCFLFPLFITILPKQCYIPSRFLVQRHGRTLKIAPIPTHRVSSSVPAQYGRRDLCYSAPVPIFVFLLGSKLRGTMSCRMKGIFSLSICMYR